MALDAGGLKSAASGALKAGGGGADSLEYDVSDTQHRFKSYHRGGKVRKSGPARLKKGERVLTKKQARKYDKKRGSK
jgi:hypothetical protein